MPIEKGKQTLMDDLAKQLYVPFDNLIDDLSKQHLDDIDWWASELAARNTYTCRLFYDIVAYFSTQKTNTGHPQKNTNFFKVTKHLLGYFLTTSLYLTRWLIAKLHRKQQEIINPITLVDIFVLSHSFNKQHVYQDRYYSKMREYLSPEENHSFYYNPTLLTSCRNTWKIFKSLRRSPQNFLIKEDYLKLRDYVWAFLYPLRAFKFFPRSIIFEDHDITALLRCAFWETLFARSSIESLLKYRFALRLKKQEIPIRFIIDWFEGHNIDKVSTIAFKHFYPQTPIIGYLGFIAPENYRAIFPTPTEEKAGVLPNKIAVCGKTFVEKRVKLLPNFTTIVAPAFRFEKVYRPPLFNPALDQYNLLVTLHLSYNNSYDLLKLLFQLDTTEINHLPIQFWIKPHPDMQNFSALLQQFSSNARINFKCVSGDVHDLIEQCHLLVGNTSSTCVESLAKGVPCIIIYDKNKVAQNPIPESVDQHIWRQVASVSELKQAINELLTIDTEIKDRLAKSIRAEYFEPVTKVSTRKLLRLD